MERSVTEKIATVAISLLLARMMSRPNGVPTPRWSYSSEPKGTPIRSDYILAQSSEIKPFYCSKNCRMFPVSHNHSFRFDRDLDDLVGPIILSLIQVVEGEFSCAQTP
ncbi:hypothetical protein C8R45DRAFT_980140 [Mycena sanguinolenta]|nr:hypothetical protein C8R45DRAFT_980140 [Mycena sanguinolenta]